MRSLVMSAASLLALAGMAAAQPLAGGPQMLDCRPAASVQTEKGVKVTRSFRAPDRAPVTSMGGYLCYDASARQPQGPAPQATTAPARERTIIILDGGRHGYGYPVGTSPNVLGAPQPRRY